MTQLSPILTTSLSADALKNFGIQRIKLQCSDIACDASFSKIDSTEGTLTAKEPYQKTSHGKSRVVGVVSKPASNHDCKFLRKNDSNCIFKSRQAVYIF